MSAFAENSDSHSDHFESAAVDFQIAKIDFEIDRNYSAEMHSGQFRFQSAKVLATEQVWPWEEESCSGSDSGS